MENGVETEVKSWNLHGYEIQEGHGGYLWRTYVWQEPREGGHPFKPFMECFMGRTWIEEDTLIMSPWKVGDDAPEQLQSHEAVSKHLASLPAWDKTKYYVKICDIGMSGLMDCRTNEPTPDEIADVIMPKLGFKKVVVTN